MNPLWTASKSADEGEAPEAQMEAGTGLDPETPPVEEPKAAMDVDVADIGVADVAGVAPGEAAPSTPNSHSNSNSNSNSNNPKPDPVAAAARPPLNRNSSSSIPPPPSNPPPRPSASSNQPPDSLSLSQLRRIVSEFPRNEAAAYDFVYSDTGLHAEEIDEWFVYQFWERMRLNAAQRAFETAWEHAVATHRTEVVWDDADDNIRSNFIRHTLQNISSTDNQNRINSVAVVLYLVLGRWAETAGSPLGDVSKLRSLASHTQLEAMKSGVRAVAELNGLPVLWDALRSVYESLWVEEPLRPPGFSLQETQDLLLNLMTIMYTCIQVTITDREGLTVVDERLRKLEPNLAGFMINAAAKLRWQDGNLTPVTQTLLLLWKSVLLVFGGTRELEETKHALQETSAEVKGKDLITSSPLDYHVFRQEITSKYPAYVPPQLSIPLEADNTSLLPPLRNTNRNNGSNGILPAPPGAQNGGASILHQPVHIATPAPSPPPSPAVGGKGGKKQNYQTNQNFPFMYPPLDASSNSAGGKGGAGLQDVLVGRRWEGSDVPASILEAGELFSKRVRMTRATRQLWQEREKFMKFERGWDPNRDDDDDIEALDLDSLSLEDEISDEKILEIIEKRRRKSDTVEIDLGPNPPSDPSIRHRLESIESFYEQALPQLQSLVMVLMKGILASVTACVTLPTNGQQHPGMGGGAGNARLNGGRMSQSHEGDNGLNGTGNLDNPDSLLEDLDAARSREIESKAATGVILLLLKWLKLSHILKFEYLTQLLLDSNYIPLVLKLFAHQDIQHVVDSKTDRKDHSFFHFCNERAAHRNGKLMVEPTEIDGADDEEESEDDVAPPPIKRRRSPPVPIIPAVLQTADSAANGAADNYSAARPEVDELGYPINPLPKEPLTDFSRRNFFALINYLRIMQKICKNKAHRNLLLVQYKSSNIIRKSLKIPQQELRLYTLKLFKNQVPYCGRKWRQSNMRVITAVYLHCRPELRDEWLAGSDVDAEVEEALPLEQGLRSLTHWFNVRRYPNQMAEDVIEAVQTEQDFFKRELDKLELWHEANSAAAAEAGGPGSEWDHPLPGWG